MVTDRLPLCIADDRMPILVTGITGVGGLNCFTYLRRRYGENVLGQRPERSWRLRGPGVFGINLEDGKELQRFVKKYGVRTILSTGGSCALKGCELDQAMAERVNVGTVRSIIDCVRENGLRFVHFSIDLVYGGTRGGDHRETDRPDPVTVYGRTMEAAENEILSRCSEAAIGRISLPMGISFNSHAGAIDWIESRFAAGRPATLYYDEIRTPTYVECLAEVSEQLIASDLSGLWHLGGTRRLSLNQIAQIINRVGGYDPDLLKGCYRIEAGPVPPRAGDVSMDSTRIRESLGRTPFAAWPLDDSLVPSDREWHYRRSGWKGSPELIRQLLYQRKTIADLQEIQE